MWALPPEPATEPGGGAVVYWKIGAGGVVSAGAVAQTDAVFTNVLYGATRPGTRTMSEAFDPDRRLRSVSGAAWSRSRTGVIPPAWTNSGFDSCERIPTSGSRADRRSPTTDAVWHWYTASRRVIDPSTGSSNTRSAAFSPADGRSPE